MKKESREIDFQYFFSLKSLLIVIRGDQNNREIIRNN